MTALPPAETGALAEASRRINSRSEKGESGFLLLKANRDALNWRLALVDHAQQSIDVQYYIWKDDAAGSLLFGRLLDAAERGVRVRMLVDDFTLAGDDRNIAALCHHPQIDIKIFNPGKVRNGFVAPLVEFVSNFELLNRRMHNKAFIADNRLAIVGGRNIGDEYFGLSQTCNFVDLDVLAAGPIVPEITRGFDRFWNSEAAFPGEHLAPSVRPAETDAVVDSVRSRIAATVSPAERAKFPAARRDWTHLLKHPGTRYHFGTASYFYDAPSVEPGGNRDRFLDDIPLLVDPERPQEMLAISPYLVPGEKFLALMQGYVERGARVGILAPSMDANDTRIVHSHYRQHRRDLVDLGAELYELRGDANDSVLAMVNAPNQQTKAVVLHLKTFVGDRKNSFIGSLNLDPRSIEINTEGGLRIESPTLAEELAAHIEWLMSESNAWQVRFDRQSSGSRALRWDSRGETRRRQPAAGMGSRTLDALLGLLPLQDQL